MKKIVRSTIILLLFLSVGVITGCGSSNNDSENTSSGDEAEKEAGDDPVTIANAGRDLTFEEAPERVVALYQQEAELFAALDLEDKLVGYSIVSENTPPEYQEKLAGIDVLAEDDYPSKEILLEADPDFVIGSERTFNKNGVGTIEKMADLGIDAYVTESKKPETIENMVYKEIEDIAQIFGIEERGEELIQSLKDDIESITDKVDDVEDPVQVMLMSSGGSGSAQVSGGDALDSYLIELAGGDNIFGDEADYLLDVSWEEIVDRDPDVIVTSYCCGTEPEQLKESITSQAIMEDVTAVKNDRFIASQVEETTGNVRVAEGLKTLAEGFYPDRFD